MASHHLIFAKEKQKYGKVERVKINGHCLLIKNSCWLIGATWTLFAFVCDVWVPVYSATNWATLRTLLSCSYRIPIWDIYKQLSQFWIIRRLENQFYLNRSCIKSSLFTDRYNWYIRGLFGVKWGVFLSLCAILFYLAALSLRLATLGLLKKASLFITF